jgi:hypothetical protein
MDNLNNKLSDEAQNQPSCLGAVGGSPSFKEQLLNDFIPRIEVMKEKERLHLHWLIDNDAPLDFIQLSQKYYNHFSQRIKEYQEYAERL